MLLPTISLAVAQIAVYMRLLRSDMIATLQEDFITTAKAKGIPARRVLFRHALRPSSLTLLTVAGLNVGALIGGAHRRRADLQPARASAAGSPRRSSSDQLIETQALVAIIAVIYVLVNFFVDLLYTVLDPTDPPCPSQSPDTGRDLATQLDRDELSHHALTPELRPRSCSAAWSSGPEADRSKTQGLGIGGWLCVVWLAPDPVRRRSSARTSRAPRPEERRRRPPARLGSRPATSFGTDSSGRDVLSLVVNGTYNSMYIGIVSVLIGFVVGGLLGIVAGYFKGAHRRRARRPHRHPARLPAAGPRALDRDVPRRTRSFWVTVALAHRVRSRCWPASRVPPRCRGPSVSS